MSSSLKIIEDEAHRIDAVVAALRKITDIRTTDYTSQGHDLMLDIAKDIETLLKERSEASSGVARSEIS